ncbi:hypothetical protein CR513_07219, partial [Mucuna pruriens]
MHTTGSAFALDLASSLESACAYHLCTESAFRVSSTRVDILTVVDKVGINESASSGRDESSLYWDDFALDTQVISRATSLQIGQSLWIYKAKTMIYNISLLGLISLDNMIYNSKTLKEFATPDIMCQPWCIQYPELEQAQSYELKSELIHLLPKFHGLSREDPHKHLKEFHVACSTTRQHGIPKDYIKMKAFPFSLDRAAKDWLYL